MKPSWSDSGTGLRPLGKVTAGGLAARDATVRPARLDRQLGSGLAEAGFIDEQLEQRVRQAAEAAREAARAEGYSAGWAQGRKAAAEREQATLARLAEEAAAERSESVDQLRNLIVALGDAARQARAQTVPQWAEVADVLAEGALQLANAALGRELRSVDTVVADSVRAALRALEEPTDAVVYLHPNDAALLDAEATPGVRVVADPSVAPGSLVTLTSAQRLRLDLPAALRAAEEVLRGMTALATEFRSRLATAASVAAPKVEGRVAEVVGLGIGVHGIRASVGELVTVTTAAGALPAQVIALHPDGATCMPLGATTGVSSGDPVTPSGDVLRIPAGYGLLGRVVDALGRPIDDIPPAHNVVAVSVDASAPNPLHRRRVKTALPTGVRTLDTLIPVGAGQRVGIMAGSGVGKSTLLGMAVKGTAAPVRVVALVGERGREVREFIEDTLDQAARRRTVIVVATADDPALLRVTAAFTATRIAEWFRDEGEDVLLVVDSVTRTAMAQREVALAAGEPPATRGYPASVFAMLPRLLERSGPGEAGSITALYTVLVEGDDLQDPIGDTVRGILDGHVVLSRQLATAGHFPSIDVLESVSRVERAVVPATLREMATTMRRFMAAFRDVRDLVEVGAYAAGSDPDVDAAIRLRPAMEAFLRQAPDQVVPIEQSWAELAALLDGGGLP